MSGHRGYASPRLAGLLPSLVGVAVLVMGCSGPDAPSPERAAEVLAEDITDYERPSGTPDQADGGPEHEAQDGPERSAAFVDAVARCMKAEGFDFVPAVPTVDAPVSADEPVGYGIVASVLEPVPDPNEEALANLDPGEQKEFLSALWGDPVDGVGGCAGDAMAELEPTGGIGDDSEGFVDRGTEELRTKAAVLTESDPDVLEAVQRAVACANEKLGDRQIDDSFDFLSVAEYRVASILNPEEADAGATLFDLVASSDDGRYLLDDAVVQQMIDAEEEVRRIEVTCRRDLQAVIRRVFVEVATDLLIDDPDTAEVILQGGS